jgi:F-type H+-transporting ATPase subunit epsilon
MADINLEIISPSKTVFQGAVNSLTVPGSLGNFQILKNHAPLVSSLEIGEMKVDVNGEIKHFAIAGGTIEVLNNKVLILADAVENVEEIDLERAIRSKERAEKRLSEKNPDVDLARARASLLRALNRIKLKENYS